MIDMKAANNYRNFMYGTVLVLLTLWTYTCWQGREYIRNQILDVDNEAFVKARSILREKVESYVHGLQGMGGFVIAKDLKPKISEVRSYAEFRHFFTNFPGALGYGFIRHVRRKDLESYIEEMRLQEPTFKRKTLSDYEGDHFIIEIIEPLEKNKQALGLDVSTEATRRDAAIYATENAIPTLTGPIELVQAEKVGVGFLYYLPIYSEIPAPTQISERKSKIVGWAYTPILAPHLVEHLKLSVPSDLVYQIWDVTSPEKPIIIHDGVKKGTIKEEFVYEGSFVLGGRVWKVLAKPEGDRGLGLLTGFTLILWGLGCFFIYVISLKLMRLLRDRNTTIERLESVESWQAAVLSATSFSVIATGVDGVISFFNKSAERMLGYRAEEVIGVYTPAIIHVLDEVVQRTKDLEREFHTRLEPGFETFVYKTKVTGTPDTQEWTYVRKDQSSLRVRLTVTAILDKQGVAHGYLGIAEDISNIKELEETIELQRLAMIEGAKMSALGEMAGGIAHEINNPLTIINSRAGLLLKKMELGEFDKDTIKEEVSKMMKTVERIGKIVKGLRTFSRDGTKDKMVKVSLANVVNDTLDLCQERFYHNGIELKILGDSNLFFMGRETQISQVIMNLLSNAFDASKDLPEKWVALEVQVKGEKILISVTDSGEGIPIEIVEKMMQPFYTSKEVGKGTGLGLSISKSIMEDHGGTLYYDRDFYNTRFVMELPKC